MLSLTFWSPMLTVTTVWNTGETGDINLDSGIPNSFYPEIMFTILFQRFVYVKGKLAGVLDIRTRSMSKSALVLVDKANFIYQLIGNLTSSDSQLLGISTSVQIPESHWNSLNLIEISEKKGKKDGGTYRLQNSYVYYKLELKPTSKRIVVYNVLYNLWSVCCVL